MHAIKQVLLKVWGPGATRQSTSHHDPQCQGNPTGRTVPTVAQPLFPQIVGIMHVLVEIMNTWHRLLQLKEASRPENISFECRGTHEPDTPHAIDVEQPEGHIPVLSIARPESVSSDYGDTNEHPTQIGEAIKSYSTLWVLQEPPRSRSAQSGRALDVGSDVYRHSYIMWNQPVPRSEVCRAVPIRAFRHRRFIE